MGNFKRIAGGTAAFVTAMTVAIVSAGPAYADGIWAAIYYSARNGAWGAGNNASSEAWARDTAQRLCIENGGTDCSFVSSVVNGCVALVLAPKVWAGGHGPTRGEAIASATQRAGGNGTVEAALCTRRSSQILD
jgi:hypothetical protein